MAAGRYDIALEAGSVFQQTVTWNDSNGAAVNLTGYSARLAIRRGIADTDPLLTLTSPGGGLTLGGSAGTIAIRITAIQTATLATSPIVSRLGRYDLELVPPSGEADARRLLEGSVTISGNVTR